LGAKGREEGRETDLLSCCSDGILREIFRVGGLRKILFEGGGDDLRGEALMVGEQRRRRR